MICKNCNKNNIEGARFCHYCGSEMTKYDNNHINEHEITPGITEEHKFNIHKGTNKRSIAIICIIAVVVIFAVAGFAICYFMDDVPVNADTANSVSTSSTAQSSETVASEQDTSISKTVYENIIDNTGNLNDSELSYIQKNVEDKNKTTGLVLKVIIEDSIDGDIQKYADDRCEKECGKDGILIIMNTANGKSSISLTGNGKKFISDTLSSTITKAVNGYLKDSDNYNACKSVLNLIPDNEESAKIYDYEMVDGAEQVIYVESDKNSHTTGKMVLVDWSSDKPEVLFETENVYLGMDGITDSPSENKSATPKGTFKLGFAFSTYSLDTKLNTEMITSGTVWVNDPDSNYYNTIQHGSINNSPKWSSAENTYSIFSNGINYACILIEHNGDGYTKGKSGKGSAIYIAGKNKNLTTSYGDVNISADDMKTLLSYLEADKNPYIVIS